MPSVKIGLDVGQPGNAAGDYQFDYAALRAAGKSPLEGFEENAFGDWVLGTDLDILTGANSLVSRVNSEALAPNATAPSYSAGYLTIPSGGLNGLKTTNTFPVGSTWAALVKKPATNPAAALVIATTATGVGGDGGEFIYFSTSSKPTLNVRGFASPQPTIDVGSANDWLFVARTMRDVGDGTHEAILYAGHADAILSASKTGTRTAENTSRPVALGNAYQTTTNYTEKNLDANHFAVFDWVMESDEVLALYRRWRVMAKRRGPVPI